MKKFLLRVMPVLAVLMVMMMSTMTTVYCLTPEAVEQLGNGSGVGTVTDAVSKIWTTVLTILQILAIAAIVYAGVKYMFASAEDKADIKSGLLGLAVGAILVFGASTIVRFILTAKDEVV